MAQFDINVVVKTQQAVAGIQNVNKSLGNIEKSIQRVQRLLGAAFAFQAVASGIQSITNLSDTLLQAENRIRSVGIEGQNLTQTTAALFGVANQTRQAFSTTAEVFARTAASLKVLGLNEQEALALTTSLNQAVALSGSTTQEASNALIQFSQGLASGTLRGDELRSVLEQIPVVADVIAKQLGVTRNELRGLAKDGTITPAVIVQAFRAARVELGERFAKLIPTISQSFVVLNNRAIEVGGGFLKTSGIAQTLSKAILFLADNMETVLRVAGGLATVIGTVLAGAFVSFVASIAAATGPFGVLVAGLAAGAVALVGFGDQIKVTNDGVVSFFDVAKAVFEDFRQLVSDAFANVGSAVDPALDALTNFATIVIGVFDDLIGTIDGFFPGFRQIISDAFSGLDALIAPGISVLDGFSLTVENVAREVAAGLDGLVAEFAAAFSAIDAVSSNFGPIIQDVFASSLNAVIGVVETSIEFIVNIFASGLNAVIEAVETGVRFIAGGFTSGLNAAIEAVEAGLEFIVNGFIDLPGLLLAAGQRAVEAFGGAIVAGFNTVIDFVATIPSRISNALAGLVGAGTTAGADLVTSIGQAIDDNVDVQGGRIAISLGRIENPATGALSQVGNVAGKAFSDTLAKAPATAALNNVLEDARKTAGAKGVAVGTEIGTKTGAALAQAVDIEARAKLQEAVKNLGTVLAQFLDISTKQLAQLGTNISVVFENLGVNIGAVFQNAIGLVTTFTGFTSTELANLAGVAGIIFDELGIDIENVFGQKAATAIRIFSRLSQDQLQTILDTGLKVTNGLIGAFNTFFGTSIPLFGQLTQAASGAGTAVQGVGAAGSAAAASLGPIAVILVGIASAVNGILALVDAFGALKTVLIAAVFPALVPIVGFLEFLGIDAVGFIGKLLDAFDSLGEVILAIATGGLSILVGAFVDLEKVIDVVLKPIIFVFELIVDIVKALINLLTGGGGLSGAFGVVGTIAKVALAPIVLPIQIIIKAVEFLIKLLSGGGGLGGAFQIVGTIAKVVLAPIVAPILAIIKVVEFLINLLKGGLGDAFNFIGGLAKTIFGGIAQAGQALGGALSTVVGGIQSAFTTAFNAIGSLVKTVFGGIAQAGQALGGVLSNIVGGIQNAFTAAFNAIGGVAKTVFGGIGQAGQALGGVLGGVAKTIVGAFQGAFNTILSAGRAAFNTLGNLASSALAGITNAAKSAAGAVVNAGKGLANIGGKVVGGVVGGVKKGFKKAKKFFGFAEGGIITGPVSLFGPGMDGKMFQRGGLFGGPTVISNASSVSPTKGLGLAGEAGPEGILPLARTSNGLGVTAVFPERVMEALGRVAAQGGTQTLTQNSTQVIMIRADSQRFEDLEQRVAVLDASVEQRSEAVVNDVLAGVLG